MVVLLECSFLYWHQSETENLSAFELVYVLLISYFQCKYHDLIPNQPDMLYSNVYGKQVQHEHENMSYGQCESHLAQDFGQTNNTFFHQLKIEVINRAEI